MQYRTFGRTGWQVSEIAFGGWQLGGDWGTVDDEESIAHPAPRLRPRASTSSTPPSCTAPATARRSSASRCANGRATRSTSPPRCSPRPGPTPTTTSPRDARTLPRVAPARARSSRTAAARCRADRPAPAALLGRRRHPGTRLARDAQRAARWQARSTRSASRSATTGPTKASTSPSSAWSTRSRSSSTCSSSDPPTSCSLPAPTTETAFIARVPFDSGSLIGNWTADTYDGWEPGSVPHTLFRGDRFAETLAAGRSAKAALPPVLPDARRGGHAVQPELARGRRP